MTGPFSITGDGALIRIKVKPGAKITEFCGFYGDSLKIAVNAPPIDGKANEALRKFVAIKCDVPVCNVTVKSGFSSRSKVLFVDGATEEQLANLIR